MGFATAFAFERNKVEQFKDLKVDKGENIDEATKK